MIILQLLNDSVRLQTSSMGRFFDAVASLIDVCHFNSYEGEAPMKLEALADEKFSEYYNFVFDKQRSLIEVDLIIKGIVNDIQEQKSKKIYFIKISLYNCKDGFRFM